MRRKSCAVASNGFGNEVTGSVHGSNAKTCTAAYRDADYARLRGAAPDEQRCGLPHFRGPHRTGDGAQRRTDHKAGYTECERREVECLAARFTRARNAANQEAGSAADQ